MKREEISWYMGLWGLSNVCPQDPSTLLCNPKQEGLKILSLLLYGHPLGFPQSPCLFHAAIPHPIRPWPSAPISVLPFVSASTSPHLSPSTLTASVCTLVKLCLVLGWCQGWGCCWAGRGRAREREREGGRDREAGGEREAAAAEIEAGVIS